MKHVLKALNNQLKLIKEDLDWHKRELKSVNESRLKAIKERDALAEEKTVLMKEIERLKNEK